MSEAATIKILGVGLSERALQTLQSLCTGAQFTLVTNSDEFGAQFEAWQDGMFNGIFCSTAIADMQTIEMAQVLQNQCSETVRCFLTFETANFESKKLVKNGFTHAYCLPMDMALLKKTVLENVMASTGKRSYRSVRIMDLESGSKLDFDTYVFLPLNKKHVKFSSANQDLEKSKMEKLQQAQMNSVFVDHKDMQKFYQYSASRLRTLTGGKSAVSATERQEKLKDAVRGLFTDIFDQSIKGDFEEGRQMISMCENIISSYITKGASSDWMKKLQSTIGESEDGYNHASNVATFAALFGLGIGHPNPEDLAMAGLFHDLGLAEIPEEILNKEPAQWTQKEKDLYYTHPEISMYRVKQKRIIVSEKVEKAVLQHHECYNGRGFPKQFNGDRIVPEAQILSFADQFDYLTRVESGRARYTPLQAWEEIKKNGSIGSDMMSQLRKLLDTELKKSA